MNLKLIIIALTLILATVTASASTIHPNPTSFLSMANNPDTPGKPVKVYVAGLDDPGSLQLSLSNGGYLVVPFINTEIIKSLGENDLIVINMDSSWANANMSISIIEMLKTPLKRGATIILLSYKGLDSEKVSRILAILLDGNSRVQQTVKPDMYYYVAALRLAGNGEPLIYTMYASNFNAISHKSITDFTLELIESS